MPEIINATGFKSRKPKTESDEKAPSTSLVSTEGMVEISKEEAMRLQAGISSAKAEPLQRHYNTNNHPATTAVPAQTIELCLSSLMELIKEAKAKGVQVTLTSEGKPIKSISISRTVSFE